jgi:adenylate kinase family enzyme
MGFTEPPIAPEALARVNVVGVSGGGKSTFARALAHRIGAPYIEMDALFWKPGWQESGDQEFFAKLGAALDRPRWVLDGNYRRTTSIKWANITAVVWLDYSFPRVAFQAVSRAINRALTGKELWPGTGNRESFRRMLSRESVLLWTLQTYSVRRRQYPALADDERLAHVAFVRLRSPKEARRFLDATGRGGGQLS